MHLQIYNKGDITFSAYKSIILDNSYELDHFIHLLAEDEIAPWLHIVNPLHKSDGCKSGEDLTVVWLM